MTKVEILKKRLAKLVLKIEVAKVEEIENKKGGMKDNEK